MNFHQEITPPKTSMAPENTPLEKEKHLQRKKLLGFHVNFRGCIYRREMDLEDHPMTCKWLITYGDCFRPLSRVIPPSNWPFHGL